MFYADNEDLECDPLSLIYDGNTVDINEPDFFSQDIQLGDDDISD